MIRAHANVAGCMPLALTAGRLLHGYALGLPGASCRGTALTLNVLGAAALPCLALRLCAAGRAPRPRRLDRALDNP